MDRSIYEYLYKNRGRELYVYYLYQQIRYVRNASICVQSITITGRDSIISAASATLCTDHRRRVETY